MAGMRHMCFYLVSAVVVALASCEPDTGASQERWEYVFSGLPEALLGVWGSSASDVFAVGSDAGAGPLVLHWDGAAWRQLATGAAGELWSVSAASATSPVWMAGEAGLVRRYDRQSGAFAEVPGVPAEVTLFGICETGSEVWAVGGERSSSIGHAYHLVGGAFVEDDTVPAAAKTAGHFFKVWGRSPSDLWIVGLGDKMLHRDASGWQVVDTPSGRRLFAIHGNDTLAVAVGGFATGLVVEITGGVVTEATPPAVKQLNGVWVEPDGAVLAVGIEGTVQERRGSVWQSPTGVPASTGSYQAVYVDPEGGVWAVGGFLEVEPRRDGVLLHYGAPIPSAF